MILSISSFALGVGLYAISQLVMHGKLRWQKVGASFWGKNSHLRKWKYNPALDMYDGQKEAFWGSSRWFVFVTDGYHLMQFFFIILFSISAVSYETIVNRWVDGGIYWGVWHICFWITYTLFQRKKL